MKENKSYCGDDKREQMHVKGVEYSTPGLDWTRCKVVGKIVRVGNSFNVRLRCKSFEDGEEGENLQGGIVENRFILVKPGVLTEIGDGYEAQYFLCGTPQPATKVEQPLNDCGIGFEERFEQCSEDGGGEKNCKCVLMKNSCKYALYAHYILSNAKPLSANIPGEENADVCTTSRGTTFRYLRSERPKY
ncbi:MAG: hypothetical protein ACKVP4_12045 [Hyphomicrobium sp.]